GSPLIPLERTPARKASLVGLPQLSSSKITRSVGGAAEALGVPLRVLPVDPRVPSPCSRAVGCHGPERSESTVAVVSACPRRERTPTLIHDARQDFSHGRLPRYRGEILYGILRQGYEAPGTDQATPGRVSCRAPLDDPAAPVRAAGARQVGLAHVLAEGGVCFAAREQQQL
ncbi:unnamed protein product, partial [Scytosiphon promiscuus]